MVPGIDWRISGVDLSSARQWWSGRIGREAEYRCRMEILLQRGASLPLITILLAWALILTAIFISHRQLRMLTTTHDSEPDPRRVERSGRPAVTGASAAWHQRFWSR